MKDQTFIFDRKHYVLLIGGIVLMIIGYLLMSGGGSDSPDGFNPAIFSNMRIVVAPILVVAGLLLEILAIMTKGPSDNG